MVCRIKRGFAQTKALAERVGAAAMMLDSEQPNSDDEP
jgi:hypothetical protein